MSTLEGVEDCPNVWNRCRLSDFVKNKSGNHKLIKGKQSSIPGVGLIQGFSASGPDVWVTAAQDFGPGVVVSAVGARCGKTFLASGEWSAIANTYVLRPGPEVDNRFLWYLTNREEWWLKSGTSQPFVKVKDSLERQIALPPLKEQEKIVEILDEQLSRLDAALASVISVRSKVARFRRSLLHSAFNGELNGRDDSKGFVFSNWMNIELGKVGRWITGSTPSTNDADNFGGDTPFVTPGDISDQGRLAEAKRSLSDKGLSLARKVMPPSVLLVCIGATLGKVAIANQVVATNQQINSLEPNSEIVNPRYIELLLSSQDIQEQLWSSASSTTVPIINKRKLESIRVVLPTTAEQIEIVEILDEHLFRLNSCLSVVNAIERRASTLRRSLLYAAFTGELTKDWRKDANV